MTVRNSKKDLSAASGNLNRLLLELSEQYLQAGAPAKEVTELAKTLKTALEIRQELQPQESGQAVRVILEKELEEYAR